MSSDELFQRLFWQRQSPDNALLHAAQACSLVYSFHGEALEGVEAELPRLASIINQTPLQAYRHVGELLRRDLVQQRGVWRAVLPHAIANRLAARALEDIPYDIIHKQLIEGGSDRLTKSFTRRLSYLHDHPRAVAIVKVWLEPDGPLGDVAILNDLGRAMFKNVAPVLPEAALMAFERVGDHSNALLLNVWQPFLSLLRSLAYDSALFERSAQLLVSVSIQSVVERVANQAKDVFISLFTIHFSGTHATIEQRLNVIEELFTSTDAQKRELGLSALDAVLEATHFSSHYQFEFGARSRNFGYYPKSKADVSQWYGARFLFDRTFGF